VKTPQINLDASEISKSKAQMAAKAALQEIVDPKRTSNRTSSFALYTWGGLAVLSAAVALSAGFFPSTAPEQQITASLSENLNNELPENADEIPFPKLPVAEAPAVVEQEQFASQRPDLDKTKTAAIAPSEVSPPTSANEQAKISNSLGVDIGGSNSIPVLSARFSALKLRAPELFEGIKPLVRLSEAKGQLDARLIAGPFSSSEQLASFCREVRLRLTLDCAQTGYDGDTINLSN